jgi:hypothetical protein
VINKFHLKIKCLKLIYSRNNFLLDFIYSAHELNSINKREKRKQITNNTELIIWCVKKN